MNLIHNPLYSETLEKIASIDIDWDKFNHKTFMLSGATGLIGRFFVDVLMYKNLNENFDFNLLLLGRNEKKANEIFSSYLENEHYRFIASDVNKPLEFREKADYILHLASNTHPKAYSSDPIGTITTNIFGTYNLLKYASEHSCERFLLASSVEIYGENRKDVDMFHEDYLGYINCNTMRAGYPESKRCSESLCQAFMNQCGLDTVIARLSRVYGPTMNMDDSKALSQFIKKSINHEDIVLKSEGNQFYSYTYVADAVSALLYILDKGRSGEAYNIADKSSDIMLKDLAEILANIAGTKVVFELPDEEEKRGYSTATVAVMSSDKLKRINWRPFYDINCGLKKTVSILKSTYE